MTSNAEARSSSDAALSAARWRRRGEEIRTLADNAMDLDVRAMMERMAAEYDRLARWSEWRSAEFGGDGAGEVGPRRIW
jgi:hypothetical protein